MENRGYPAGDAGAAAQERAVQEFYMDQVRGCLTEEIGAPSFFVTTIGCQMNARDSE